MSAVAEVLNGAAVPSTAVAMAGLIAEDVRRLGLSQRQFADLVGASTKHVNLVLNGRTKAHPDTLDTWLGLLGRRFVVTLSGGGA